MKSWNIEVASERKQRELMKTSLEELSIEAETVPFSFNMGRRMDQHLLHMWKICNLLFSTSWKKRKG